MYVQCTKIGIQLGILMQDISSFIYDSEAGHFDHLDNSQHPKSTDVFNDVLTNSNNHTKLSAVSSKKKIKKKIEHS